MFKIMNKSPLRTQSHTNTNILRFNPSPKTPFVEQTKIISPGLLNPINGSYFQSEKRDNSAQTKLLLMPKDQQQTYKTNGVNDSKYHQLSICQPQTQNFQNDLKTLKDKCQIYEQELSQKVKEINQLKDLLSNHLNQSLQNHSRSEEMLLNENEELRQLVINHQEQVKQLRREKEVALLEMHNKVNEQIREIGECHRMVSIYESLKEENETLLRMLSQKDQEIQSMLSHFSIEKEIYQKQIQQLKEKLDTENFMQSHIKQIDEANQELNRCLAQIQSQQYEIQELEKVNHNIQKENKELLQGIDSKNSQIDEMVLKYGELDEEYKQVKKQFEIQIQQLKEKFIGENQQQQHQEQSTQSLKQEDMKQKNDQNKLKEQNNGKKVGEHHLTEIAKLKRELQEKNEELNQFNSLKMQQFF